MSKPIPRQSEPACELSHIDLDELDGLARVRARLGALHALLNHALADRDDDGLYYLFDPIWEEFTEVHDAIRDRHRGRVRSAGGEAL